MNDELDVTAWITGESLRRLDSGVTDPRGTVPVHVRKSVAAHRGLVLRADAERLLAKRDARIAKLERALGGATAETKTLREAADELLEACDTSDGCCYGTLSTSFIKQVLGDRGTDRGTDRDALIAQLERERDEATAALRDCLMLASRHRHEEWAQHVMKFCARGGVVPSPLRGE